MERRTKITLSTLCGGLLLFALLGYGYYQSRDFLTGPLLSLVSPDDGATFSSPLITVKGSARNIAFLSLNGRRIFTDQAGNFSERLLLPSGYSIMTLVGTDRFGHRAQKQLELVYKPPEKI